MAASHQRRSYGQSCLLARALDVVGERWTLLLVRELFSGPKRFTDLHAALDGMGTNLLADRLKELARAGVIERTPDSTRTRPVYRLTPLGEGLRPALRELFSWGAAGGAAAESEAQLGVSASRAFPLFFDASVRPDWIAVVEMRIPGDQFQMRFHRGSVEVLEAGTDDADVVITTKQRAWNRVATGSSTLQEEIDNKRIRVEGSGDDFGTFCAVFGLTS